MNYKLLFWILLAISALTLFIFAVNTHQSDELMFILAGVFAFSGWMILKIFLDISLDDD